MTGSVSQGRIVVVEDDPAIAGLIVRGLRRAGYVVALASTAAAALTAVREEPTRALVLDLMLPDQSGFTVLKAIRAFSDLPVIVLTARSSLDDRLRSFQLGATDFVPKPFFLEELLARLEVRLGARSTQVRFGSVALDRDARQVVVAGQDAGLTRAELEILLALTARPGQVVTREALAEFALGPESDRSDRSVDVHVSRLRTKLGDGADAIATVRGYGYRFDPPGEPP